MVLASVAVQAPPVQKRVSDSIVADCARRTAPLLRLNVSRRALLARGGPVAVHSCLAGFTRSFVGVGVTVTAASFRMFKFTSNVVRCVFLRRQTVFVRIPAEVALCTSCDAVSEFSLGAGFARADARRAHFLGVLSGVARLAGGAARLAQALVRVVAGGAVFTHCAATCVLVSAGGAEFAPCAATCILVAARFTRGARSATCVRGVVADYAVVTRAAANCARVLSGDARRAGRAVRLARICRVLSSGARFADVVATLTLPRVRVPSRPACGAFSGHVRHCFRVVPRWAYLAAKSAEFGPVPSRTI